MTLPQLLARVSPGLALWQRERAAHRVTRTDLRAHRHHLALAVAQREAERVLRTEAESEAETARCELIDEAAKVRRLEAQIDFLTSSLSAEMDEAWGAWLNGEGGVE